MNLTDRNVVWGLEGCGKSSQIFSLLSQNNTGKILFGFKNYSLMVEQMHTWSERFDVPIEEFVIAGNNLEYGPALKAYTNPDQPYFIPNNVKYVFTTQAQIQKLGHREFIDEFGTPIEYAHIVIDEFDFCIGIVPSLDYQLKHLTVSKSIKDLTEKQILSWVYQNYTKIDANRLHLNKDCHFEGFNKAYWLEESKCPITFLTSEVLAYKFLELIGFTKFEITERADFSDCIINIWSSPFLGRNFFNKMNAYVGWNKLNYDSIISDCVQSYFESNKNEETLEIQVFSHTATRGRNDLIGKNILTVLSYIPPIAIKQIQETFKYFGDESLSFEEVEKLFYRDRLCQAIGRVVGHRGGKTTDVITHSNILEQLENIPYTLNTNWKFTFDNFDFILEKIEEAELARKEKSRQLNIKDYSFISELFILSENSSKAITINEVKEYLQKYNQKVPITKIASYFNTKVKNKRVGKNKEVVRCLIGVDFKNV